MAYFKLKEKHQGYAVGTHEHGGRIYKPGEIIRTNLQLDKLFRNKFEKVAAPSETAEEPVSKKKGKGKGKLKIKGKGTPPAATAPKDPRGVDVTDLFPAVKAEELKIFKKGAYFHLWEKDKDAPINKKGLKKEAVAEALRAWLED